MNAMRSIVTLPEALERIADLEEEIAQLRDAAGLSHGEDKIAALRLKWGLTEKEARVLAVLHSRRGAPVRREAILSGVYGYDAPQDKIVDVFICKMRHKLGEDMIPTLWGQGYRLTAKALAEIDEVLKLPLCEVTPTRMAIRLNGEKKWSPRGVNKAIRKALASRSMSTDDLVNEIGEAVRYRMTNLVDRGDVARAGARGSFVYTLTTKGRDCLARFDAQQLPEVTKEKAA